MIKSTHNGVCQVCGKLQALPGGVLSLHGYTVEHHYFNGVCPGQRELPLEQDRTIANKIANDLRDDAAKAEAELELVFAGKRFPKYAHADVSWHVKDRLGHIVSVEVLYADATPYRQREAVERLTFKLGNRATLSKKIANDILALADRVHGQPLQARDGKPPKREIVAGMTVKVCGKPRKVLAVELRVVHGIGSGINGSTKMSVVYANDAGVRFSYPVCLIRQSAIVEAA